MTIFRNRAIILRGLANISEFLYGKQVNLQKLLVMCALGSYQKGIPPCQSWLDL